MSKYITVIVTDRSGNPECYATVKAYKDGLLSGGHIAQGTTDRDGRCDLSLDVADSDRISIGVRGSGRSGDLDHIYPEARLHVVVE